MPIWLRMSCEPLVSPVSSIILTFFKRTYSLCGEFDPFSYISSASFPNSPKDIRGQLPQNRLRRRFLPAQSDCPVANARDCGHIVRNKQNRASRLTDITAFYSDIFSETQCRRPPKLRQRSKFPVRDARRPKKRAAYTFRSNNV